MKRELIVNTGGQDRTVVVEGPQDNGKFQIEIRGPADQSGKIVVTRRSLVRMPD